VAGVVVIVWPFATFADPTVDELVNASILMDADVPGDLRLIPEVSRGLDSAQQQGRMVVYGHRDGILPASLALLPRDTIIGVINVVMTSRDDYGQATLDAWALRLQSGGPLLADLTLLENPPVGDASRALTYTTAILEDPRRPTGAPYSSPSARLLTRSGEENRKATAAILFRRAGMYVGVIVSAIGTNAPLDDALRLAHLVDERLVGVTSRAESAPRLAAAGIRDR
jgi:hypothetical protein